MSTDDKLLVEISDLLIRAMDNAVTADEFARLQHLLKSNPSAREYYFDLISTLAVIEEIQELPVDEEKENAMDLLTALAENEKTASAVELVKPKAEAAHAMSAETVHTLRRRVSKFSMYSLILSSAALFFLLAYAFFVSSRNAGIEVATLSDSIDAKWSCPNPLLKGTRLATGMEPIQVTKGIIKFRTDNGAQLLLEGPAEFQFINSDELSINYGRIFVNVEGASNGFIVQTQKSKIIDLGTQFGVYTDIRGESELHVFEGKTVLIADLRNKTEQIMDVSAGQARAFSGSAETIQRIGLSEDTFAKSIDSQANLVWRGQKEINLADVVGGGSGFGTGLIHTGISPVGGYTENPECVTRRQRNTYLPVASNVFVDGVFVPSGYTEQVISSDGCLFKDCPVTSGHFYSDIINTPKGIGLAKESEKFPLVLGDINYSTEADPCISLHANLGITFDLSAFRSRLPGAEIDEFRSSIGISDSSPQASTASFWVLIDGQIRYRKDVRVQGQADTIQIKIGEIDRYLTLVTTDGSILDPDKGLNSIGYDWCLFGRPVLVLK